MSSNQFSNLNSSNPWLEKLFKNIKAVVLVVIVAILLSTAFFQVGPEEVGVIVQFGKYQRTVDPGLNYKIPFMESVYKVPVERQQKLEFGFRTTNPGIRTEYTRRGTTDESLMLTGDLNLADVEWVVQYRIDNAYNYLFKVRNPETTLRDISEAAMRQIVGDRTVNEVLTVGRTEISSKLQELMQKVCREYSLGVKIEQVVLQDVNPPEPVKAAFNSVNEAQQEKETLINQAKAEYNKVIPKAAGQAKETIQMAEGYASERVNNAKGDVARFNALYTEYVKAPEVTKKRIYLETMESVIPKLGEKIITDQKGNSVLPLLQMQLSQQKNSNNGQ
ncbi:FtsH protease activity modulator HflK [Carboxylicivirga caseinilyticus]|uniref:FtsH protease activity modulator HflK n=1 Tax=Carboxylicivirga caseinilyticus TaxID=3417572 RepID=UPI002AA81E75|nr:FtsH protease activity modulator HflK [uncultured Carboxylicivirga sp.]MCU4163798.1 FtsH protease activity modulator HflK [Marinilabiliaceae bacterium A049]